MLVYIALARFLQRGLAVFVLVGLVPCRGIVEGVVTVLWAKRRREWRRWGGEGA